MSKQITPDDHSTPNISVIEVPEYFYAVDINYLSHMIADMLGRLISHNDLIPLTPSNLTRFHSRIPPNISLVDYLRRIIKFTSIEKSCLLIILIYIDRVCERHPQFTISSLTVHRFLITAVTVSSKALSDSYCTNSHYARIGGISTQELNALELEFLSLIDWHLASTGVILQRYYTNLVAQHPCYHRILSNDHTITMIDHVTSSSSISTSNRQHSTSSTTSSSLSSSPTSSTTSISPNNNTHKSKKRRRQSSIISTNDLQNLQQQQEGINNNKDSSGINNNNNNNSEDDHEQNENDEEADEEEEEERRIWAHFDQLSNIEWIPYIA